MKKTTLKILSIILASTILMQSLAMADANSNTETRLQLRELRYKKAKLRAEIYQATIQLKALEEIKEAKGEKIIDAKAFGIMIGGIFTLGLGLEQLREKAYFRAAALAVLSAYIYTKYHGQVFFTERVEEEKKELSALSSIEQTELYNELILEIARKTQAVDDIKDSVRNIKIERDRGSK